MVDNQVQYKRTCDCFSKGQRPWGYSKIPPPWGVRPPCPHPAHGNHYAVWRGRRHLQPPTRAWNSHRSRHHAAFCYPQAGCLRPYLEHLRLFLECLGSPYRLSDAEAVELVQKERESLHGSKSTTWSHRVSWLSRCVWACPIPAVDGTALSMSPLECSYTGKKTGIHVLERPWKKLRKKESWRKIDYIIVL